MSLGLPVDVVADVVLPLRHTGSIQPLRSLDAELRTIPLPKARTGLGLPAAWAARLEAAGGDKRHVLCVRRCIPRSPAFGVLKDGDLLLAVNGRTVVSYRDVEVAVQYTRAPPVLHAEEMAPSTATSAAPAAAEQDDSMRRKQAAAASSLGGGGTQIVPPLSDMPLAGGAGGRSAAGAGSTTKITPRATEAGGAVDEAVASRLPHGVESSAAAAPLASASAGASMLGGGAATEQPPGAAAPAAVAPDSSVGASGPHHVRSPSFPHLPVEPTEPLDLTVLRDGVELHLTVRPSLLNERGRGTDRLLLWAGMLLQEAHEPVEARGFVPGLASSSSTSAAAAGGAAGADAPRHPYCSRWSYGSPAHRGEC